MAACPKIVYGGTRVSNIQYKNTNVFEIYMQNENGSKTCVYHRHKPQPSVLNSTYNNSCWRLVSGIYTHKHDSSCYKEDRTQPFKHHPSCSASGSGWGTDNGHIHCGYPLKLVCNLPTGNYNYFTKICGYD